MKRGVEELIGILGREGRKRERLKEIVKGELRSMVKELLEEVALVEREAENGFYPRDIEGFFGSVEDVKIPRNVSGTLPSRRRDQDHGDTSGAPLQCFMGIKDD